jgi:hypothetical protein
MSIISDYMPEFQKAGLIAGSHFTNLVPRVLFVWPRAEENPGKGCENNPQFVDYFVTWYV